MTLCRLQLHNLLAAIIAVIWALFLLIGSLISIRKSIQLRA